jgi:hypothetical protein
MKMIILVLAGILTTARAAPIPAAEYIDRAELEQLHLAVNADDLFKIQTHFKKLRVLQGACKRQADNQSVPFACYELRSLVPEKSLLANILIPEEQLRTLCLVGATKFRAPEAETVVLPKGDCRAAVEKQMDINRYKQGL